jgi:DNA gyrase/topoisomerase IV subunit B
MNPEQLATTTMMPAHRTLRRVDIEDALEAGDMFEVPHGRRGRTPPQVHRGQRPPGRDPGHLMLRSTL